MNKLVAVSILTLLFGAMTTAQEREAEFLPSSLFPLNLVIDRQEEIGLSEAQVLAISALTTELEEDVLGVHREISQEAATLEEILAFTTVDERDALASFDRLFDLESRERTSRLLQLVRLKNLLTESQQERLTEIRGGTVR